VHCGQNSIAGAAAVVSLRTDGGRPCLPNPAYRPFLQHPARKSGDRAGPIPQPPLRAAGCCRVSAGRSL